MTCCARSSEQNTFITFGYNLVVIQIPIYLSHGWIARGVLHPPVRKPYDHPLPPPIHKTIACKHKHGPNGSLHAFASCNFKRHSCNPSAGNVPAQRAPARTTTALEGQARASHFQAEHHSEAQSDAIARFLASEQTAHLQVRLVVAWEMELSTGPSQELSVYI